MKMMVAYALIEETVIETEHGPIKVPLQLGKGMVGVMPVFKSVRAARAYCGKHVRIQEVNCE